MSQGVDPFHPKDSKSSSLLREESLVASNHHDTLSNTEAISYSHPPQDPRQDPTVYSTTLSNGIVVHSSIDCRIHNHHLEDEIIMEESPRWKDRLSKCCKYGICHPSYICGCCCSIFGIAQVLFRILQSKRIKYFMFWLITTFFIAHFVLEYILYLNIGKYCTPDVLSFIKNGANRDQIWIDPSCRKWMGLYGRFSYIYFIITVVSVAIVRYLVRKKYSILPSCRRRRRLRPQPSIQDSAKDVTSSCDDGLIEDCCFSIFCASCVTAQMMRHTGTYESFRASFCSYTGLTLVPSRRKKRNTENSQMSSVEVPLNHVENGIC